MVRVPMAISGGDLRPTTGEEKLDSGTAHDAARTGCHADRLAPVRFTLEGLGGMGLILAGALCLARQDSRDIRLGQILLGWAILLLNPIIFYANQFASVWSVEFQSVALAGLLRDK